MAPLLPAAGDTTVDVNTESFNGTQSRTTMTSKVQTDTSLIAKIPDRVRSVLRNSWNGGGGETEACYSTSATEKTTGVTTFANTATKTPVASGLSVCFCACHFLPAVTFSVYCSNLVLQLKMTLIKLSKHKAVVQPRRVRRVPVTLLLTGKVRCYKEVG